MMIKYLGKVFLLLLLVAPVWALDVEPLHPQQVSVAAPRPMAAVQAVELIWQDDQPVLHITGMQPDGCERSVLNAQERQGAVLFVDVFFDPVAAAEAPCPDALLPLDVQMPVAALYQLDSQLSFPQYLVVNDLYFSVEWKAINQTGASDRNGLTATLLPAVRTELQPSVMYTVVKEDQHVGVMVAGHLPEGCKDPVLSRVQPLTDTAFHVDIFRIMADPFMCPLPYVAIPFEEVIPTPLMGDQTGSFELNGSVVYHPEQVQPSTGISQAHTITSVTATVLPTSPARVILNVQGSQRDGCLIPVHVSQVWSDEHMVSLSVFRMLPLNIGCTSDPVAYAAAIRLDRTLRPGTYTIDVNGTVITVKI